jgi:hypothetical protein
MSTEKFNLIFKAYPEEIQLSKNKRAIWIHISEKEGIPKYITKEITTKGAEGKYYYDSQGWVVERESNEKVIRNVKSAGKPNMRKINGQAIWDGSVDRYARNNLKLFLTEYFTPTIVRHWPETIFTSRADKYFHIEFIFYMPIKLRGYVKIQDVDNHAFPYTKSFADTLVQLKVIPNDNAAYYRGLYSRYVDIPTEEDRRLEVKLHFCDNNERLC